MSSSSAMERGSGGEEAEVAVSSEVWAVLSAAVADMTGNDSRSSSKNATTSSSASVDSPADDGGNKSGEEHMVQPSHSQAAAATLTSESRRQKVVDLAKKRIATSASAAGGGGSESSSRQANASSAVPATVTCTEGGDDDKDSSSGLGMDDDKAQEERETLASLSPGRVERSIDEIKAKMMMVQEDSDDEENEELNEAKEGSEVRIRITSNAASDATSNTSSPSTKLQQTKEKAPPPRLTIDVPFDERPRVLPDDVPSFDAGEDWEGSTRRPASPPTPLPPVPPPAPTNATSKAKHFFGGRKDKKKKAESNQSMPPQQPPGPPSPDSRANEVPNAQSTSYEDSDIEADVHDETPLPSKLPPLAKDVNEDVMASVARARAAGLVINDDGISERQNKRRSSTTASGSSSSGGRRRVRSSGHSKSLRRKGRTNVSEEDQEEKQQKQSRRHHTRTSRTSIRKGRSQKLKRPESTMSDEDQTKSTMSFAETTSKHGIGGSKGILEACDPIPMDSTSPKSSLILEFEDQDLIGWIMNGDACTSLQKCGTESNDVYHSHRVEQVTSEDDDMSDISNLTGKWRRSRLLVEEQQRRKAAEEANKRHSGRPFDFMSMLCGDLKAMFCDGLKPDAASF